MLLTIPNSIVASLTSIEKVVLDTGIVKINLLPSTCKLGKVILHQDIFEQCKSISFDILYKNGVTETIVFEDKNSIANTSQKIIRIPETNWVDKLLRKNTNTIYEDTDKDKFTVYQVLKQKAKEALAASSKPVGTKNLVYFSIGGDIKYLDVLEVCLNTLVSNGGGNFDLLFICPESWIDKIQSLKCLNGIKGNFLPVPETTDGVEIAMNRLNIYDYQNIDNYKKILYMDCDILVKKNINKLFNATIQKKLNTAYNENIPNKAHGGVFHSLRYVPAPDALISNLATNKPFNSGQYTFVNSLQMKKHFDNVRWFASVWPGEYFTDQAFLCAYFCFFDLTKTTLQDFTEIYQIQPHKKPQGDKILLHFIGECQKGQSKLDAMKNYANL